MAPAKDSIFFNLIAQLILQAPPCCKLNFLFNFLKLFRINFKKQIINNIYNKIVQLLI